MTKEHCLSKQTKWRTRHFVFHEINLLLPTKHQPGQAFPMAKKSAGVHFMDTSVWLGYGREKPFVLWKGASEVLISSGLDKSANQQISHRPSDAYILSPAWKVEEIRYPSPVKIQAPKWTHWQNITARAPSPFQRRRSRDIRDGSCQWRVFPLISPADLFHASLNKPAISAGWGSYLSKHKWNAC